MYAHSSSVTPPTPLPAKPAWWRRQKASFPLGLVLVGLALTLTHNCIASAPTALSGPQFADPNPELKLDLQWPRILVQSSLKVGNKGEEAIGVAVAAECGKPSWVFNHAEIDIVKNRFGDAQFVGYPKPGCSNTCSPIVVRWYHEPTGHLAFGIKVYRRKATIPCEHSETSHVPMSPIFMTTRHRF